MGKRKLQILGALLMIIPSVVLAAGDITMVEIIWAAFSIITGLFVLRSAWLKSKNEIKRSQLQYTKYDVKKIHKMIYISALLGGILSVISLLQADLTIPIKLFSILGSLFLIIIITKIVLKIFLKRLKNLEDDRQ